MCERCDDVARTVRLLDDLAAYAERPGADREFADIICEALGASLELGIDAEPGPGHPTTEHPGEEW